MASFSFFINMLEKVCKYFLLFLSIFDSKNGCSKFLEFLLFHICDFVENFYYPSFVHGKSPFDFLLYLLIEIKSQNLRFVPKLGHFFYLQRESYKSVILICNPLAIFSKSLRVGLISSLLIRDSTDLGTPVICSTCRRDNSFSNIIFFSNIFITQSYHWRGYCFSGKIFLHWIQPLNYVRMVI